MARECDHLDNTCKCNFTTSSGDPVLGTGTVEDPYIFPVCDDPMFIIEDCDGNQQPINCGEILRVYPSGFNGGPIVQSPTVQGGILYIPRPTTTCLNPGEDEVEEYGPWLAGAGSTQKPSLLEDVTLDFKGAVSAMVYGSFTVCQQLPAPDAISGECFQIIASARSGANPIGDPTPNPIVSDTIFNWEPPADSQSENCQTFTFFDDVQAQAGNNSFTLSLTLGPSAGCPHDPTRVLVVKNPKMCLYY